MRIELEDIHKFYNRGQANEVYALQGVNLKVCEQEVVCIQGPSGSGKSTLLSLIGCVFQPTSGSAKILGKKLSRLPDHFLTVHRRHAIGFIFQRFNLIDELTVYENITLPLVPLGYTPKKRHAAAQPLLEQFGIDHRRNFTVNKISGGEMQRTAIARALIMNPPIILADEPTAHLDSSLRMQFMDFMAALKRDGKTIVITSHDPEIASHPVIDRVLQMKDGQLHENGV